MSNAETIHVYPVDANSDHQTDGGFCWCQPVIEDVLPSGRIIIHRRTVDSPHFELPPADPDLMGTEYRPLTKKERERLR